MGGQLPWENRHFDLLRLLIAARLRAWIDGRFLGLWWWLFEPLAMTLVYLGFVEIALDGARQHVALFLMSAVLPWTQVYVEDTVQAWQVVCRAWFFSESVDLRTRMRSQIMAMVVPAESLRGAIFIVSKRLVARCGTVLVPRVLDSADRLGTLVVWTRFIAACARYDRLAALNHGTSRTGRPSFRTHFA